MFTTSVVPSVFILDKKGHYLLRIHSSRFQTTYKSGAVEAVSKVIYKEL